MTTTAQNNFWKGVLPGSAEWPLGVDNNSSHNVNAGDLVFFDLAGTINGLKYVLGSVTTDAQAGSSVGVSQGSNPINSISTNTPVSAMFSTPPFMVVNFNSVFKFNSTAGDTINWLDALYIGADSQTLTNTAGGKTNILGRAMFPPSDSNGNVINPPVAGGVGVVIYACIKPLFTLFQGAIQ